MTAKFELKAAALAQTQGGLSGERLLFQNIDFCWRAPSLHVIMGSSGCGKSSFLKTIGGVWCPQQGNIQYDGAPLWMGKQQNPEILRRLGFAFQNNALFNSMRVIENVSFPYQQRYPDTSSRQALATALQWLEKVGLEQSAYQFPFELSGGMQKRLAIVRTLALQPDFIFLDDPTAGLDPITSKVMAELVHSLLKGSESLVVIVTNDPDRARDWGPNIHFLSDKTLISSNKSELYSPLHERFL